MVERPAGEGPQPLHPARRVADREGGGGTMHNMVTIARMGSGILVAAATSIMETVRPLTGAAVAVLVNRTRTRTPDL